MERRWKTTAGALILALPIALACFLYEVSTFYEVQPWTLEAATNSYPDSYPDGFGTKSEVLQYQIGHLHWIDRWSHPTWSAFEVEIWGPIVGFCVWTIWRVLRHLFTATYRRLRGLPIPARPLAPPIGVKRELGARLRVGIAIAFFVGFTTSMWPPSGGLLEAHWSQLLHELDRNPNAPYSESIAAVRAAGPSEAWLWALASVRVAAWTLLAYLIPAWIGACDLESKRARAWSATEWCRAPDTIFTLAPYTPTMRRVLVPVLLFATVAPTQSPIPALVAHRGASYDAPENTLASTKLALERGADAVEIDLRIAKDGTLVVIHDATTARTSDRDVRIANASWSDLKDLDVGAWKAPEYRGERIPRFEEVLEALPHGKQIFVDVKAGPEIAGPLSDAIDAAVTKNLVTHDQVVVIAFDAALIAELERRRPATKTQWLTSFKKDSEGRWNPRVEQVVATAQQIGSDGVDVNANLAVIDEDFVRKVRASKLELHAWTVNDTSTAIRLASLGFDSITTDRPAYLRRGLTRTPLADVCLFRLDFDHGFRDTSSSRLQLTLPERPSRTQGVFGMALDLRERGGTVGVPLQLPTQGTFTAWIRSEVWRDYQTIFDTSANANEWECWIDETATLHARHRRGGASVSHRFHEVAERRTWQHVAVTWSPAGLQLFVGGRLVHEATTRDPIPAPGKTFHLGGGHPGNTKGQLAYDDVALFSRPLEADEIDAIYRRGLTETVGPVRER